MRGRLKQHLLLCRLETYESQTTHDLYNQAQINTERNKAQCFGSSSIYGDANILREMCTRYKMKTRFPAVSLGFKLQCIIKPEIDMVYELGRIAFKRVSLAIYLHVMSTCWS